MHDADDRALAVKRYKGRGMPIARTCRMMGIAESALDGHVRAANPERAETSA